MSNVDWPTKQEAAAALGVSTKTLEKYVADGKLGQEMQSRVNLPPRAVIDPATLEKVIADRSALVKTAPPKPSANLPEKFFEALAEPRPQWPPPLYLTEAEAVRYSGLGIGFLRSAVAWKRSGPRGCLVCRRADLDAL